MNIIRREHDPDTASAVLTFLAGAAAGVGAAGGATTGGVVIGTPSFFLSEGTG